MKEVSKCTKTSEQTFSVKIVTTNDSIQPSADSLISVVWSLSVVGGIGGKQMTPELLNEAFLAKNHDSKSFFSVTVNT